MSTHQPLTGKVALIIGGTRGIGLSAAHELASRGARLLLTYKSDSEQAGKAANELSERYGVEVDTVSGDLRKPADIEGFYQHLGTSFDQLDILVVSAAFGTMGDVARMGRFSWKATYQINVTAPLLVARGALPWLKREGGRIIMLSSIGGQVTYPQYSAIGTSKAAVEALIRQMGTEWARYNIHVVGISAGPIETRAIDWFRLPEALRAFSAHKNLVPRMGQPDDIGKIVGWLATPGSAWITGTTILADGGMTVGLDSESFAIDAQRRARAQESA